MYSLKTKDDVTKDEEEALIKALEGAINEFIEQGLSEVRGIDLWERASAIGNMKINTAKAGGLLRKCGVSKRQRADGNHYYNIAGLVDGGESE
jgi:hypothetical protein